MSIENLNIDRLRSVQRRINGLAEGEGPDQKDRWVQGVWMEPATYYGIDLPIPVEQLLGERLPSERYLIDPREEPATVKVIVSECGSKGCIAGWGAMEAGCLPTINIGATPGTAWDIDYGSLYDPEGVEISAAEAAIQWFGVDSLDLYARDPETGEALELPSSGWDSREHHLFDGDLDLADVNFIIDNMVERATDAKRWAAQAVGADA